jgi:hypothetical protein
MNDVVQDLDWFIHGRTGISSRVIWCVMNGRKPERGAFGGHPHDPDDFSRCYLLLQRNPTWRINMDKLRSLSREWNALVEHWDELEGLFLAIFGGTFSQQDYDNRKQYDKSASERMYTRMREIIEASSKPARQSA